MVAVSEAVVYLYLYIGHVALDAKLMQALHVVDGYCDSILKDWIVHHIFLSLYKREL